MSGDVPRMSVLLAITERVDALPTLLSRLEQQDFPAADYEVIAVFYGKGAQRNAEMTARFSLGAPMRLRCEARETFGEVAARNRAAVMAAGERVLFVDQDTLASRNLVRLHATPSEKPEECVFMGVLQPHPTLPRGALTRWFLEQDKRLTCLKKPHDPLNWSTQQCSMPRELLLGMGGFDESFHTGRCADLDLAMRLLSKGVMPTPLAHARSQIWHAAPFREERRRHMAEGYDLFQLARKWPQLPVLSAYRLESSALRHWLEGLTVPLYVQAVHDEEQDVRLHGIAYRRVFTYDRRHGYLAAVAERPLNDARPVYDAVRH